MPGQGVELHKRTLVQQRGNALARSQFALLMHPFDGGLTDRVQGLGAALAQFGELARGGVDVDIVLGLCLDVGLGSARHRDRA